MSIDLIPALRPERPTWNKGRIIGQSTLCYRSMSGRSVSACRQGSTCGRKPVDGYLVGPALNGRS